MNRDEPVVVVPHDPLWPQTFAEIAQRIRAALGDLVVAIEHVGSTAVPGLDAKPIVDLDVVLRSERDLVEASSALNTAGYASLGDLGIVGREAFRAPGGAPRHHLYVCAAGATELQRHLTFRDALRADPELAAEYGALKRHLAQLYRTDRDAYAEGKTAFISRALAGERDAVGRRAHRRR